MSSTVTPLAEGRFLVHMSEEDWAEAVAAGTARDEENRKHPFREQTHGAEQSRSLEYSIRGTVGEKAVCVFLGVEFKGKGTLGEIDIEGRYEVKSSSHPSILLNGKVPGVRGEGDNPAANYIATQVSEILKTVVILGWARGSDVMVAENWGDHFQKGRPCYKVDAGLLKPIKSLPFIECFEGCLA